MDERWRALIILTLARTAMGFQFQSLGSAGPALLDEGLSHADLGLLIGLYFLPGVVVALPAGMAGRRYGDVRVVTLGLMLMVAGSLLMLVGDGFWSLALGRLATGVGAVLLNVLMSKMIADWFAGREIVLAMGIFVNSFPIGVGLALAVLSPLAAWGGVWPAMLVPGLVAGLALGLLTFAYQPHPGQASAAPTDQPNRRELALVCLAGLIWGLFNGAFGAMVGFAPLLLGAQGWGVAETGVALGAATWGLVVSVQAGAILAQRGWSPLALMGLGSLGWGGGLILLALGIGPPGLLLLAMGLLMGLPVGIIVALPAQVLRPESRAVGMGYFYLWLYVGHGALPALAGWLRQGSGSDAAPLLGCAVAVLAMLPLFLAFRVSARR